MTTKRRAPLLRLLRHPLAAIALGYLLLVVLVTVFAGRLAPYAEGEQDLMHALEGPSQAHLLGTGVLGRDVLSQLLYGGRVTLLAVLISVGVFVLVGLPLGLIAGYLGGWVDRLVLRIADVMYAVPAIIILLVVLAIRPNDEPAAMVVLGLLGAPGLARVVRSAAQNAREELYVRAAQASGLSDALILRRHILPRVAGPAIVQIMLFGAAAILLETGIGFLGLGSQSATWGGMVSEASQNIGTQPWLLVPSGFVIITFILALGLLGDGIRDTFVEHGSKARPVRRTTRSAAAPAVIVPERAEPPGPPPLLDVRGLAVELTIDGRPAQVVRDVSFQVARGEVVGIVGESGSGKTITATALLGLLPAAGRITAGSVRFEGEELVGATTEQLRRIRGRRIGWVTQDPMDGLDPTVSAGRQIAEAVRVQTGCAPRAAGERARDLLGLVRVPDVDRVAGSYPHQLSGGLAQRVAIAAALAGDPALLIADEPTTALDVTVQAQILDLLHTLSDLGTSIMLVTHDWGVLADLSDRAVVMYAGQVVEQGTVAELVSTPRHPYTAGLLRSNPHNSRAGEPLWTIDGVVPPPSLWPVSCAFADRCPLVQEDCRAAAVELRQVTGDRESRCLHSDELLEVRAHG